MLVIILTGHLSAFDAQDFADPPSGFRPEPFWGLNDDLQAHELRRQVQAMADGGWGGFFIHPRHGLETPYLSRAYLDHVAEVADEAKRLGLRVWLYDEHPFPSGAAGGLVGAGEKRFRHRVLAVNVHSRLTPIEEGVAYFSLDLDHPSRVPTGYTRILDPTADVSGVAPRFVHFYVWEMPVARTTIANHGNSFLHGFPVTDLLNPEAVSRFIDITYERHRLRFGAEFSDMIVGAFSDIPVYNWHYSTPHPSFPWTSGMAERFVEAYGYDLIEHLPALLFDVGDYRSVRHDFWELASNMFVEAYTEQLAGWCRTKGIAYSAHYWGEEAPHWQVPWAGDVMHHQMHQDVVGNDHILRNIDDPLGVKQAATVAEQLGKERVLTEIYALSGYNLSFEERKWIGEWACALGTNLLVPYIPSYSLRGRRKRDEPPSEFVQQPYWLDERLINDYFTRLSYALSSGKRVVDVLLMQPLSTAWALYRPSAEVPSAWRPAEDPYEGAGAELFALSDAFRTIADWLLRGHRDFHVGNERLMAEHGEVADGRLVVGHGRYRTVVVPPSVTWRSTTVDLLRRFVASGGRVVSVAPAPTRVNGRARADAVLPSEATIVPYEEAAFLDAVPEPDGVRIGPAPDVIYAHRIDDLGQQICFLANTSRERAHTAIRFTVPAGADDRIVRLDPLTGATETLSAENRDGSLTALLDFEPTESYLLLVGSLPDTAREPVEARTKSERRPIALDQSWTLRRAEPNVLVLDYCELKIEGDEWGERIPVWQAQHTLARAGVGTEFTLAFEFEAKYLPEQADVAVEDIGRYDIAVNDRRLEKSGAEPWFDPRLLRMRVTNILKRGQNRIELAGRFGIDTELESVYLTGRFALEAGPGPGFVIVKATDAVVGEDITAEGYPFLVGRPTLTQRVTLPPSFSRATFVAERIDAVAAHVSVNGRPCGVVAWRPYSLDITPYVKPGANDIEIELVTSLHNVFGPHHDRRGEVRHFVIDGVWTDRTNWTDSYFVVPLGITGAAVLLEEAT